MDKRVRVIASARNWIVGDAHAQLNRLATLPGVIEVVGMPDLHPGKGNPVGAAVLTEGVFHPHLAGNDIGCGMALWQTDLLAKKAKIDRWVKKLNGLESPMAESPADRIAEFGLPGSPFDASLGTIGGGNHFAELPAVESVTDGQAFVDMGLEESKLFLMVHSGSRGLGDSVLRGHLDRCGFGPVSDDSEDADSYMKGHEHARRWAELNRQVIGERFTELLGTHGRRIVDLCHNSITCESSQGSRQWLHRKGAAPSDNGLVILPGSRGTLSYLLMPKGDQTGNLRSVAHGAGQKWARSDARGRLERRYSADALRRTALGGRVICDDKDLLYEEAPQAYKDIDVVVSDLIEAGLVRVVASLRPLISYKTRNRKT